MEGSLMNVDTTQAVYSLVDTLGITFEQVNGKVVADRILTKDFGPFKLNFPVRIKTDLIGDGQVAIIVHVRCNLWAYVYSSIDPFWLWIVFIRGDEKSSFQTFKVGDYKTFLKKFSSSIVESFAFIKNQWKHTEVTSLLK